MNTPSETNVQLRQTMVSFAYLAYTGEGITTPNPDESILQSMQAALPKIKLSESSNESLENWEFVWGPVAYTVPGGLYQDNLTYIVKKKETSDYVIALRGTNFMSQVDWFLEDFEILNTMPWPIPNAESNAPTGAAISESTSIDLNIQISNKITANNDGVGVLDFLHNETANGPINVCVTGHSLGGVLSNTLALYLLENPIKWDQSSQSIVSCISFAAPAGGNDKYAQHAVSVFAEASKKGAFPGWDTSNVKTNLDNVRCSLDVVPLVPMGKNIYSDGESGALFAIYASPNNPTDNINFDSLPVPASTEWSYVKSLLLKNVAAKLTPLNYTQLKTTPPIIGEFVGNTLKESKDAGFINPFLEGFAVQAAWQHSNSYAIYFNVPTLFDPTIIIRHDGSSLEKPQIDSISPQSAYRIHHFGKTVHIKGKNFKPDVYGNFLVFSDPTNPLPYTIQTATETEIVATFFVDSATDGPQHFFIYTSSPYYKSNSVTFTID